MMLSSKDEGGRKCVSHIAAPSKKKVVKLIVYIEHKEYLLYSKHTSEMFVIYSSGLLHYTVILLL